MISYNFKKIAAQLKSKSQDFSERSISFSCGTVKIFFIAQLTDKAALNENIVKPLVLHCSSDHRPLSAQMAKDDIIYSADCMISSDTSKIENFILCGMVVLLFSTDKNYVVVNIKKIKQREIPNPQLSYTIRGPQDCFVESLDDNISLVRYRLKDKNLRIKRFKVGVRSKTNIAVLYVEDIANNKVVNELQKRISDIDVDGIGESGELQSLLSNSKPQIFPQFGLVERSDMAFHSLLKGKCIVIVDGSGLALVTPKTFSEFFHSSDDKYDNKFFGLFSRILRYTGLVIAFTASSIFVALTSFHTDVLPVKYAISLAEMRSNAPFTALTAALVLEFITEMIREALLRVPNKIGSAIGIVGAIVIGQAAISAGIFSPLLLIIVSTALIASFTLPDYTLITPFRILKFVLLVFTGTLGFFGFTLFLTFILILLVSQSSFGVPYMAPWAPFNLYDFIRTFVSNITTNPVRPHYLHTKNKTKTKRKNDR